MRKPAAATEVIYLPPASRPNGGDFSPSYSVEFTVENLPEDNFKLLKEVSVINSLGGSPAAQTQFTDIDFSFDVDVKKGRNELTIKVKDALDRVVTRTAVLEVR
jgi:hypothetical protein